MLTIVWWLLIGWILSIFGFSNLIIGGVQEFFDIDITLTSYYFIFAMIGIVIKIVKEKK